MEKIIRVILAIIGIFLILDALFLIVVSNMNTGVLGTLILGIILILIGALWNKIKQFTSHGVGKAIKYIILILFIIWFVFLSFITIYGKIDNVTYKEDAVIVLGCGVKGKTVSATLAYRLDKTVEYYNKNPEAIIVVTGGQGTQEEITEAEAMEKYLIENGIPKEKIIKEEKATSTTENMLNSKKILDGKLSKDYKVAIITNNFHVFRATQIAKKANLNVSHYNADIRPETVVSNYIRETLGVAKYYILGK